MGQLDADDSAPYAERREVRLVTEAFNKFCGASNERLGIEQPPWIEQCAWVKIYHWASPRDGPYPEVGISMPVARTGWFICHYVGSTRHMVGELMTLPVRVGVRVSRFALNTTLTLSARALALVGETLQSVTGEHENGHQAAPSAPRESDSSPAPGGEAPSPSGASRQTPPKRAPGTPGSAPAAPPEPAVETPPAAAPEPAPELGDDEPEPVHVSEEPELVAEVSEPGAEDGAGAAVTVDEPWDGYTRLNAKDIVDHLANAGTAELAAIQLYESTHKRRETVLTAVTRELARQSAGTRLDRPD